MLVLWQTVGGRAFGVLNVSSPVLIAERTWAWLKDGSLLSNLAVTLREASAGFVVGTAAGVIVGILLGSSLLVARILGPFVSGLYAVPKVVLAPLLVVWFGIGVELKVWLSFLFVVFLVIYTTWSGLTNVSADLTNSLRLMGASRLRIVRVIVLPAVFAWVLTGLRVSFPLALIGALLGEMVASSEGIGHMVTTSGDAFDVTGVLVGVLTLTVTAIVVDSLFSYVESLAKGRGLVGNI
ncbi:ABC transporter permease [Dactylosporangium sp. CA-092794]|uniref:ABC transporter permease n=1 Tax=Dactylosporangium sp. CA-092794 TaxID=3239929 RepID=UPI003D91F2D8